MNYTENAKQLKVHNSGEIIKLYGINDTDWRVFLKFYNRRF